MSLEPHFTPSDAVRGDMAEKALIALLRERGIQSYQCDVDSVVDVLAWSNRGFFRIQVKSAALRPRPRTTRLSWLWNTTRHKASRHHADKSLGRRRYSPVEVDLFAFYRVETRQFSFIPVSEVTVGKIQDYADIRPDNQRSHCRILRGFEIFDTFSPFAAPQLGLTQTNTTHLSTPNLITTPSQYALDILHS